ncbi:MAG: leucine--tRNA ligase [Sulfolobales archaeon]|nr:leucine--tRNA ligase [Sulfolobales archaeon]
MYEADPKEGARKFFTTAAFPYPNSPMHIGHARTYVTADIIARFKRMRGFNVLFPMGFHYTGTPIIAMADDVAKGDKDLISIFTDIYEIPNDVIPKLADPLFMANYFKEKIKEGMKALGLSVDWRREFTTIDPEFSSFIVWQFKKLNAKGFLVRDTHPVGWCPVHNIPVGMHDTKGDVEPEIGEFVLIFFDSNDLTFPAATLRPETVFGAVAVWVNPNLEYKIVEVGNRRMVVTERGALKLQFQRDDVKVVGSVKGSELTKLVVRNPITGREIPVLGASFIDPDTATGVVMSVPAHAPFDYYYMKKVLKREPEVVSVIEVEGKDALAASVVEQTNPKNDKDLEKLTQDVYRLEYNKGRMKDVSGLVAPGFVEHFKDFKGLSVPEARRRVTEFLISRGLGSKMYEVMNRPVYCRCGTEIVVKVLKDQWFLDYGNPEWKSLAKKLISEMTFYPEDVRKEFLYVADWLQKRACARTRGLGTPLPWDKKWIIESLSDSTIYMAYYTVAHKIKENKLYANQLTEEFWDYVMLGLGSPEEVSAKTGIPKDVIEGMRREFTYWYPLDVRHSGKDLIPNHLSFFIFNHVAIFPKELWPRAIAVNGFVLYEGKKMSKSLRNIVPVLKALRLYGTDVVRVAVTSLADFGTDIDFSERYAKSIGESLRFFYELVESLEKYKGTQFDWTERWIRAAFLNAALEVTKAMENFDLRTAGTTLIFALADALKEYMELTKIYGNEPNGSLLRELMALWTKMVAPFAPHLAEEMWHRLGNSTFVVTERWPEVDEAQVDKQILLEHEQVKALINDVRAILNVYKGKPSKVKVYVASKEKTELMRKAVEAVENGVPLKQLVQTVDRRDSQVIVKYYQLATEMPSFQRKLLLGYDFDEREVYERELRFIESRLGLTVEVYPESELKDSKKTAAPLKPAILIE